MPYKDAYIDFSYKPNGKEFLTEFFLEPAQGVSHELAAEEIAGESSIGTWTEVAGLTESIKQRLSPTIYSINKQTGIVKIAYPAELFEKGNVSQLMSAVAGNIFGMSSVKNLRLQAIDFPKSYLRSFKGPEFGIPGIRKLLKVKDRPFVGTIVKPKVGQNPKGHANIAYQAWIGGCDIVKDDENLTSMTFNNFESRLKETVKAKQRAEKETGEKKVYMPNVTAPYNEMLRRAKLVKKSGNEYAMVDVVSVGWSALQELRNADLKLVLHAHRAGHAAFTRNPKHGISMLVLAELCRLIGLDQLHVGAIFGKMVGSENEVKQIGEEIEQSLIAGHGKHVLERNWLHLKPTLAVCSGGLHPGKIESLVQAMGKNIVIQLGGGIHGHPQGTIAGAMAARQATEAAAAGISKTDYAKTHSELRQALEKWEK